MSKPIKLKSSKTQYVPSEDLIRAYKVITDKKIPYDLLYQYYRGDHPLRYSTERLRKAFDKIGTFFAQNWIAVVVDTVLDRINLNGFDYDTGEKKSDKEDPDVETTKTPQQEFLEDMWDDFNMELLADDVHEAASVTGEGYIIAWKEETTEDLGNGTAEDKSVIDVFYNDPRMCHVFYDPYRPTDKRYAAKLWVDSEGYPCMILYYPDRLEHYKSISKIKTGQLSLGNASSFRPDPEYGEDGVEPNEYGIIPVFHFKAGRTSGKREIGKSEISLQDAINKLFADMMVSSEFTTWTQRVIISQADPGDLKNTAGSNWWIPAGDGKGEGSKVLELGAKSLDNYLEAMDKLSQALAIISRTPKHYLMLVGAAPSGDALLAMEAPLVKKVQKRISSYEVEWKNLVMFLFMLNGFEDEDPNNIVPIWSPVETSQPLAIAQTIKTEGEAGIPLETSLRRQGWGSDEIEQMRKDKSVQEKRTSSLAQQELNRMRKESEISNTNPDGSQMKDEV